MPTTVEPLVRPFREEDRAFIVTLIPRLVPERTVSPRPPAQVARALEQQATGERPYPPGTELFIAVIDGKPVGLVAVRPDADYFTGHLRAYIELLAVAEHAGGKGIGRALMEHAEQWARQEGCLEAVLDVFADNASAIAFYRRLGYEADHLRLAKPLASSSPNSDESRLPTIS